MIDVVNFRAMGSGCRIVVDGPDGAIDAGFASAGQDMVRDLERRWTRFDPDSEVSRLNASDGALCLISAQTYGLLEAAMTAATTTQGRFNPFMGRHIAALGYDASWNQASLQVTLDGPALAHPSSEVLGGCTLYPSICAVELAPGLAFDPGGIGKGLAADLVAQFLVDAGATTACVEMGGDTRLAGKSWQRDRWTVHVTHPLDESADIATFALSDGAVATSSRLGRRWTAGGRDLHHLLDPTTGQPAETDLVAVTISASTTSWAEVAAKVVLIGGSTDAEATMLDLGVSGIAVTESGEVIVGGDGRSPVPALDGRDHDQAVAA